MPAESVTLPAINPIPAPLTGSDFLASSHFKIGHDRRLAKSARRRSTFKKDYIPPPHEAGRPDASIPPAPAEVMHRDQFKNMNDDVSETHTSFYDKGYGRVPMCNSLTTTNFKMDADQRIDSFRTTHSLYYARKPISKVHQKDSPMKSYIPNGDPEKAAAPVSDYRDKFTGHDTSVVVIDKAPCMHTGGPSTIKGDGRTHTFTTSSSDEFYGKYLPFSLIQPDTSGSNIPQGDIEKVINHETTQKLSYPHPVSSVKEPYDKTNAHQKVQGTNFKLGAAKKYDRYVSTAKDSYDPKIREYCGLAQKPDMGVSSFPEGDLHPDRVLQRISTTTSNVYLKGPPKDYRHFIVSGANKRTASNVEFGEPKLAGTFYSTTEKDAFPAVSVPVERAISHHYSSNVPMDYYGNEVYHPTTWMDFPVHRSAPPMALSKERQSQLRDSHLSPPLHELRFFDTEHLTSYTPKTADRLYYDSGKLQKSSVPLGTFNGSE